MSFFAFSSTLEKLLKDSLLVLFETDFGSLFSNAVSRASDKADQRDKSISSPLASLFSFSPPVALPMRDQSFLPLLGLFGCTGVLVKSKESRCMLKERRGPVDPTAVLAIELSWLHAAPEVLMEPLLHQPPFEIVS
jgi:hypothetical protein